MWFKSWGAAAQVLVAGFASYVLLVLLLRTSGKRTLSKLNAFDLVVTVAMGSTLATTLLSSEVSVAQGTAGFLVLVLAQYAVAKISVLSPRFAGLVRAQPRLLVDQGQLLHDALRQERVTRGEVLAAIRQAGLGRLAEAAAVVLESDGSFSVIPARGTPLEVLQDVRR
ncbi:DUF421 domain-containing protein [Ramlibacter sp. AN1133]|uniref:DUF421 domain-containing protein n=1 Tax=Ramlibacter sp. AN1133 TaxID=3133429 RepID=UPI0030BCFD89